MTSYVRKFSTPRSLGGFGLAMAFAAVTMLVGGMLVGADTSVIATVAQAATVAR